MLGLGATSNGNIDFISISISIFNGPDFPTRPNPIIILIDIPLQIFNKTEAI
jgi:hypothetical protein